MLVLSCVNSLLVIGERYWQKLAAILEKPNHHFISICTVMGAFLCWVLIFVQVLINGDVVIVIKIGANIHGVLVFCGCLLSQF